MNPGNPGVPRMLVGAIARRILTTLGAVVGAFALIVVLAPLGNRAMAQDVPVLDPEDTGITISEGDASDDVEPGEDVSNSTGVPGEPVEIFPGGSDAPWAAVNLEFGSGRHEDGNQYGDITPGESGFVRIMVSIHPSLYMKNPRLTLSLDPHGEGVLVPLDNGDKMAVELPPATANDYWTVVSDSQVSQLWGVADDDGSREQVYKGLLEGETTAFFQGTTESFWGRKFIETLHPGWEVLGQTAFRFQIIVPFGLGNDEVLQAGGKLTANASLLWEEEHDDGTGRSLVAKASEQSLNIVEPKPQVTFSANPVDGMDNGLHEFVLQARNASGGSALYNVDLQACLPGYFGDDNVQFLEGPHGKVSKAESARPSLMRAVDVSNNSFIMQDTNQVVPDGTHACMGNNQTLIRWMLGNNVEPDRSDGFVLKPDQELNLRFRARIDGAPWITQDPPTAWISGSSYGGDYSSNGDGIALFDVLGIARWYKVGAEVLSPNTPDEDDYDSNDDGSEEPGPRDTVPPGVTPSPSGNAPSPNTPWQSPSETDVERKPEVKDTPKPVEAVTDKPEVRIEAVGLPGGPAAGVGSRFVPVLGVNMRVNPWAGMSAAEMMALRMQYGMRMHVGDVGSRVMHLGSINGRTPVSLNSTMNPQLQGDLARTGGTQLVPVLALALLLLGAGGLLARRIS
ncbi:MAG: hypothetical protein Q4G30_09205 [Actinomycetaceae bacterium]|nr:hypothetical protein [Actinomycetaceae bacterium]